MAFSVAQHFEKNNYQDLNLLFFFCQGGVALRTKVNIVGGRSDGNLSSAD